MAWMDEGGRPRLTHRNTSQDRRTYTESHPHSQPPSTFQTHMIEVYLGLMTQTNRKEFAFAAAGSPQLCANKHVQPLETPLYLVSNAYELMLHRNRSLSTLV
jgi:hypothetical protein